MASPRTTPFIATLDSEDLLDATAPLDEPSAIRYPAEAPLARRMPSLPPPSRRAWFVVGIAGVLAAGAFFWAAESNGLRAAAIVSPVRTPPPPVHAELQAIPARIDLAPPEIALTDEVQPRPAPRPEPVEPRRARTSPQPHDGLAAALLERRKQLAQLGISGADVEAVTGISFDPGRRSARVVYRLEDSSAEVVEYWALRDGHWQPLND